MNSPVSRQSASLALRQRRCARGSGFTLVELMVVVSVIVIILTLGVASLTIAFEKAEVAQTEVILATLKAVADEYRGQTKVNLANEDQIDTMEKFIEQVRSISNCDSIMRSMGPPGEIVIHDDNGVGDDASEPIRMIRDPWGNDIKYFPHNESGKRGYDAKHPESKVPFFMSIGPDNQEGDVNGTGTALERHEDNVYSFNLD